MKTIQHTSLIEITNNNRPDNIEYFLFDGKLKLSVIGLTCNVISKYPIESDFYGLLSFQDGRFTYRSGAKKFSATFKNNADLYMFTKLLLSAFKRASAKQQCESFIVDIDNDKCYITFLPSVYIGGRAIMYDLLKKTKDVKFFYLDFTDCKSISHEWMSFIDKNIVKDNTVVYGLKDSLRLQAEQTDCLLLLAKAVS